MRTCSREQQLAGLATTPKQGEYCWSTTPVLRQKIICKYRFGEELPYLFDNSSVLQDSAYLKDSLKENRGFVRADHPGLLLDAPMTSLRRMSGPAGP
jgi:hypothetical protein